MPRTRRLGVSALALLAVTATGCSAGSDGERSGPEDPTRLRVGALGNTTDNLNPLTTNGFADYIGVSHLYESLVELRDGEPVLRLAESIVPDATAESWTITLRDDVTFSDGSAIEATDVAYSLRLTADPTQSPNYASFFGDVDVDGIEVVDERTLVVPFTRPRGDFVSTILSFVSYVYPDGATQWEDAPVTSGPYTLVSYDAGERIVMEAREDYFDGTPEVTTLEVVVIDDPQARLNALKSGEIDVATRVDPVAAQAEADNDAIEIQQGGEADSLALGFEMNVNEAPFDDPDVRTAMKLAIDRQELVDVVFLGEGFVGNDLVGLGLPGYDASLPQREHDPQRAEELFAAAGVDAVDVRVAETTPGLQRATELLAEQLADVGVELRVETTDPASFYADYEVLLSTPFQTAYYVNRDAGAYLGSFTGSNGFFNVSGFAPEGYDESLRNAQALVDDDERDAAFAAVQQLVWNDGGTIIWGYQAVLNAQAAGLEGVYLTQAVPQFDAASF
ncbi:ABC transporter substrate-binding protein [Nocardioides zeae]|uniref:Peptide/nickel transport system substrate-binding protein n=1 Tax=Nocardioides zeae TaxID=1457234 RepID=A0AAJ1X1B4_9ACTN|nr:ABC transporter substrate-binding protein [Nocardioides zeae]MDQ1105428.1 peptide/nickel transport system substrate-binding protein [Nocardioides zeae]